jgi:hypothetical protein
MEISVAWGIVAAVVRPCFLTPVVKRPAISLSALLLIGIIAAPLASAWQDDSVAVVAGADKDYVLQKFGEHGDRQKAESFVFAQGKFFGGYVRDTSLEHMQFLEIARDLGSDLALQKYYPAADARNADLLIVVHWGMTAVEENADHGQTEFERLQKDSATYNANFSSGEIGVARGGIADPGFVTSDMAIAYGQSGAAGTAPNDNAHLLGFDSELQKEEYRSLGVPSGMTEMDRRLREDLVDERYFVILMAYDYRSVKDGKRGAKPKLLWSTHFSMRASGFNFTSALPAMGKVAAAFFGHQVDGLLIDARKVPEGNVDMGVPRTVEEKKPN